ncbi:MAG: acylphosphatase [Tatlockia sp.]|nr:acylphosphatase [Tatlockia sp.]
MAKRLGMHCYISGKVQGVWFRASAKEEADKLALRGWARNLPDGRVEVFACGDEKQLELFYSWLQHGPRLSQVTEVRRQESDWREFSDFSIG